jgi:hypothetical protein
LSLPVVALCCAGATAYYLYNFPDFVARDLDPVGLVGLGVLGASPLLWIGALAMPGPASLVALRAHAALFIVLLVLDQFYPARHLSGPVGLIAIFVWCVLVVVLVIEALVAELTCFRVKRASRSAKVPPFVFSGLVVALLVGCLLGVLIWSPTLPSRVIAAAEAAAGDRSYCIDVDARPARSARDLSGWNMRAADRDGWSWNFHALLAIGEAADRRYMNWSYRTGRFEPVSDSAREGLHLDRITQCAPKAHFARGWL